MQQVILEAVRCFRSRVEAPIAPITLLVGENSTGKSSFLALVRIAYDLAASRTPNFNIEPFQLGSFDSIAHYHGGKGKRVTSFTIGQRASPRRRRPRDAQSTDSETIQIEGEFRSLDGQPKMVRWTWEDHHIKLDVSLPLDRNPGVTISADGETILERELASQWRDDFAPIPFLVQRLVLSDRDRLKPGDTVGKIDPRTLDKLLEEISMATFQSRTPYAIAPIRTRPERTYDSIRDQPSPEGHHVPVILSQLSAKKDYSWSELRRSLFEFGEKSGLFSTVDIRHLGRKKMADPFQLEVGLHGQQGRRNIIDVGYGVSQVLPILVESLVQPMETTFLVQQPEVHLHPRAQAELGSFIAEMTKKRRNHYILETHSDYIVDRLAMAIRDGQLQSRDVAVLFFEPKGSEVCVTPLEFDAQGNLKSPPDSYRSFFLEEQLKYIGAKDVPNS